jgi:hypothetical protein
MAECQAAQEAVWLRSLLNELGIESQAEGPTTILTDSQGAMALAKNPEHHQRSKHIDIRYHFVREQVAQGSIELVYVYTSDMAADQLTKPLSHEQHVHCARLMGLQWCTPCTSEGECCELTGPTVKGRELERLDLILDMTGLRWDSNQHGSIFTGRHSACLHQAC